MGRWWILHALGAIALGGCGRFDFDEQQVPVDTGALGPFVGQSISELTTAFHEDDPALTGDELEIYFDSDRPGGMGQSDIWRATRPTRTSAWDPPALVTELNTSGDELSPGVSRDGLTIIIASNTGAGTGIDLLQATRPDRNSPWSPPVRMADLSGMGEDTNAQLSTDELTVWFASRRGGANARQLWMATRASTAVAFDPPVAVADLNVSTNVYTGDPCPTADDSQLYFVSDRGTAKNIWVVDRPTPTTFGTPEVIEELATGTQTDPWISNDQRRIYYAQHFAGGETDLWMATR